MKKIGLVLMLTTFCTVSFADLDEDILSKELPAMIGSEQVMEVQPSTEEVAEVIVKSEVEKEKTYSNKSQSSKNLDQYQRIVVDESMANRQGKKFTMNATLGGINFSSPSSAIEAGFHSKADTIIAIAFHDLQGFQVADEENRDDYVFDGDGKGRAISLSLKKFTSNSFYIKPAVYHRTQTQIKSGITAFNSSTDSWTVASRDTVTYTDLGVSFKIGNQWQWETFTLGCDWVGISKSLSTLENDGYLAQSTLDSASLLNFYLGATF